MHTAYRSQVVPVPGWPRYRIFEKDRTMTLACTRVPCSRAAKSIIHGEKNPVLGATPVYSWFFWIALELQIPKLVAKVSEL